MLRDFVLSLSLANICMVASWSQVLSQWTKRAYYLDLSDISVIAVMLDVIVLALLCFAAAQLVRRSKAPWVRPAAEWAFLVILLLPLDQIRVGFNILNTPDVAFWMGETDALLLVLGWVAVLLICYLMFRSRHKLFSGARIALLALSPFVLITFARGIATIRRAPDWQAPAALQTANAKPGNRVLLIVFDELDTRMAFSERPSDLDLPAFDKLRGQGLHLTQATSAGTNTQVSLPILLTGAMMTSTQPLSSGELGVRIRGDTTLKPFRSLPNLFSVASAAGLRTGVVGWYHPYCRLLAEVLTSCYWQPIYREVGRDDRDNLARSMRDYLLALSPWHEKASHIQLIHRIMEHAVPMAGDTGLDLALLHLPVPHLPPVYDRHANRFTLHRYKLRGYIDHLALADSLLTIIDSALGQSPAAGRTTLIVTSDHPWRQARFYDGRSDPRVPVIVRMPGNEAAIDDPRAISTVVIYDLVLSLLRGETQSLADLERWLDSRGAAPHIVRSSRR